MFQYLQWQLGAFMPSTPHADAEDWHVSRNGWGIAWLNQDVETFKPYDIVLRYLL